MIFCDEKFSRTGKSITYFKVVSCPKSTCSDHSFSRFLWCLKDGNIDFSLVVQGFWRSEGMEILIFNYFSRFGGRLRDGVEEGCGIEMLIFYLFFKVSGVSKGWKY